MKKQIIILFLLFINWQLSGQGSSRKTDSSCTDKMADAVQGKWVKGQDLLSQQTIIFNKTQVQEVLNRLEAVHNLALEAYPNPLGADASWRRNLGYNPPFAFFYYDIAIHNYFCNGSNEIRVNDETGTSLTVYANDLLPLWDDLMEGDEWKIDGYPIKMRKTMIGKWKGYEIYTAGGPGMELSGFRDVLIHRNGILPYIPVTRKQFFDRVIHWVTKFYDQMIKDGEAIPVRTLEEQEAEKNKVLEDYKKKFGTDPKRLKSAVDYYLSGYQTDQQRRDSDVKITIKQKQDELKKYNEELEKSKKEGLLESPAIISGHLVANSLPVFSTEAEGGSMLVIENANYMRKGLPKYVPQVFVLTWSWDTGPWALRFRKAVEENFPIEKLQAMIDK